MKRTLALLLAILFALPLLACAPDAQNGGGFAITDSDGNSVTPKRGARVVSLYGSFAECWIDSGGTLVGVTSDAFSENRIEKGADIAVVGTVKEPNLELITALRPDYVILSADLAAHTKLKSTLSELSIPCGYFRVDTFDDYAKMMRQFCSYHGRDDLYHEKVTRVGEMIEGIKARIPKGEQKSVLLMRAYSTGIKAKTDDNLAGQILAEFGLLNIADEHPSLLEEMSMEHIVSRDPDYIIVLTMGAEAGALAYIEENLAKNSAWQSLKAVKNGNYEVLPKELFHYKPNERWGESYEYLAKIIYPEVFGE